MGLEERVENDPGKWRVEIAGGWRQLEPRVEGRRTAVGKSWGPESGVCVSPPLFGKENVDWAVWCLGKLGAPN